MKINASNPYSIFTDSAQALGELNLKEGQRIIGKVLRLAGDQALLEMAGRPLSAKVEGVRSLNPGSAYTFEVATDDQNRIILRIVNNSTTAAPEESAQSAGLQPSNGAQPDRAVAKAIISALENAGLPVTGESIADIFGSLREFEAKYQQPLPPQVITFIISQKWPINPGTILAAWIHQDHGVRDLLWNQLYRAALQKTGAGGYDDLTNEWLFNPRADTAVPSLTAKLQSYSGMQLLRILEHIFGLDRAFPDPNPESFPHGRAPSPQPGRELQPGKTETTDSQGQVRNQAQASSHPERQSGSSSIQGETAGIKHIPAHLSSLRMMKDDPAQTVRISNQADRVNQEAAVKGDNPAPKFLALLEQNQKLESAFHQDPGVYAAIPFLVRDPENHLHEAVIQWEERRSGPSENFYEQLIQLAVPTDNMGEVLLRVRIGSNGTNIHIRVGSEAVRRFLIQNTAELRAAISEAEAVIQVSVKESETSGTSTMGVDLWM